MIPLAWHLAAGPPGGVQLAVVIGVATAIAWRWLDDDARFLPAAAWGAVGATAGALASGILGADLTRAGDPAAALGACVGAGVALGAVAFVTARSGRAGSHSA